MFKTEAFIRFLLTGSVYIFELSFGGVTPTRLYFNILTQKLTLILIQSTSLLTMLRTKPNVYLLLNAVQKVALKFI